MERLALGDGDPVAVHEQVREARKAPGLGGEVEQRREPAPEGPGRRPPRVVLRRQGRVDGRVARQDDDLAAHDLRLSGYGVPDQPQ